MASVARIPVATAAPAAVPVSLGEAPAQRFLRVGLGVLWLLDGVLLAQPRLFRAGAMAAQLAAARVGQPAWLAALLNASDHLASPHMTLLHITLVALQLAAGALLLGGRGGAGSRAGAFIGLALGLGIWAVGEGFGGLLATTPSILNGAPGGALLNALASVLLLTGAVGPQRWTRGRSAAAWAVGAVFALVAALELRPSLFTRATLQPIFAAGANFPQPAILRAPLVALDAAAGAHAGVLNAVMVALFALAAIVLLGAGGRRLTLWALLALVVAVWWLGEDLGLLLGGAATDPDTAGPLALLVLTACLAERQVRPATRPSAPAQGPRPTAGAGRTVAGA
jgi:hypothetical protein